MNVKIVGKIIETMRGQSSNKTRKEHYKEHGECNVVLYTCIQNLKPWTNKKLQTNAIHTLMNDITFLYFFQSL